MSRQRIGWGLVLACSVGPSLGWAQIVNRIIAVVNDDVITEADVMSQVNALLELPEEAAAPTDPLQLQRTVLRRLVEEQLLLQEARKLEVTVSPEEVAQRLQQVRQRAGSEAAFRQWLDEAHTSEERLKERLREQLMVQRLIDGKVRATIVVSPQEIAGEVAKRPDLTKSSSRLRVFGLLVRTGSTRSPEEARGLANDLRKQLVGGAEFAQVARAHSEDPHAEEGGDMGWIAEGELLPELDAALTPLQPGELSPVIETRLGFHVLRLVDRRSASSLSMREAHRAIYEQLYQLKFQQQMGKWLNDLKRAAYIELPALPE
jgi:parvulin-like peptidyl-prolyl isomerase